MKTILIETTQSLRLSLNKLDKPYDPVVIATAIYHK